MKVPMVLTVALTTLALWGGSNDNPTHQPQTVSESLAHPSERQEKMKWCQDDRQRMALPDCWNAAQATQKAGLDSGKNYQPIN